MNDVDEHGRDAVAVQRPHLRVVSGSEMTSTPSRRSRRAKRREGGAPLVGRLDVEEREVVAAAGDHVVDPAQPFDHRRRGEERRDDPQRLRAPEREVARGRARAVAELLHDRAHARTGLIRHTGAVVEYPRDRADADAGAGRDVTDPRSARSR